MNQLTLEWIEAGRTEVWTLQERQATKNPGTIRMGRDPSRCDVVMQHPTVSGLHVEIFFSQQQNCFYLRNLRDTNPPLVDGHKVTQGEVALKQGSSIHLGQVKVKVSAIAVASTQLPQTVVTPPQPITKIDLPQAPTLPKVEPSPVYGLCCPKCSQVSPYDQVDLGCPWCGTSLVAAASILITPRKSS